MAGFMERYISMKNWLNSDSGVAAGSRLTLLLMGWVTDAWNGTVPFQWIRDGGLLELGIWHVALTIAGTAALFFAMRASIRRLRKPMVQQPTRRRVPSPRKVIIGCASILDVNKSLIEPEVDEELADYLARIPSDESSNLMPWLVAINTHASRIERVRLMTTSAAKSYYERLQQLFNLLRVNGKRLVVECTDVTEQENEDIYEFYCLLDRVEKSLMAKGYDEFDLIFDITSGQKQYSVAAGMISLHNHVNVQYTVTKRREVYEYTLMTRASES
jgi:hypothetical protein